MCDFEGVKPYTQAELDQQAIWANEFDQWWENEGQYQRAGGGQYERTFAWWAWLNREQKQQAIINNLKAQLNNMETCYIEKKKEVEACAALVGQWREKRMGGCSDYARGGLHSRQDCADDLEKALRGANDLLTDARQKAEDQINNGARLTKHQIDL